MPPRSASLRISTREASRTPGSPTATTTVDALANFDRYRAYDSLRALHQEGKIFNRIWINFLHMETDLGTPELNARLLNVFNNFGDDMVRVLGIGEFTAGNLFFAGSPVWLNGTRLVAQARWRNENHTLGFNIGGIPDWKLIIDGWQTVHDEDDQIPVLPTASPTCAGCSRTCRSLTRSISTA